jgi:hypothetical protein
MGRLREDYGEKAKLLDSYSLTTDRTTEYAKDRLGTIASTYSGIACIAISQCTKFLSPLWTLLCHCEEY